MKTFFLILLISSLTVNAYSQNDIAILSLNKLEEKEEQKEEQKEEEEKEKVVVVVVIVDGRKNATSTFNMYREPSYLVFGSGVGNMEPLIFEANIAPYFMMSISDKARWGVELSPRIVLRMYNQYSYPVRTPSYMPKATFFYQFLDKEDGERDLFSYISVMHHSNGQEGEFFNTDSTTINTRTGNFSTNWVEGGLFISRPNVIMPYNTNYVKLFATYNFMQEKKLSGTYGRLRFFVNTKSTVKFSKAFRMIVAPDDISRKYVFHQSIKVGWIAGKLNDEQNFSSKRLIFNYTISFTPTFLKETNFFIHYYYGQDYYNIHFNKHLSAIRFGIASKSNVIF